MELGSNPVSRKNNIVIQELRDELLIYDLSKNRAFCLNQTSAMIWQECNGHQSVAEISQKLTKTLKLKVSEEFVWMALRQFKSDDLLENGAGLVTVFDGWSRREIVKKVGLASLLTLPVISAVVAPTSLHAASGLLNCPPVETLGNDAAPGCPCAGNSDCCAVCGGSEANPICGGIIKPNAPAICLGLSCPPSSSGNNDAAPGCPCAGNSDCCAVCGGSEANPICGGIIKPNAPSVCNA